MLENISAWIDSLRGHDSGGEWAWSGQKTIFVKNFKGNYIFT